MKPIILIFCLGLILNSCKKDTVGIPNGDTDVTFELKFSSASSPNTRTIGDVINNDKIDYITVLVFEEGGNNEYLYRRSGIVPVNDQFSVDLPLTDNPIRIHVFVNPSSNVNSINYNGQTEPDVINSLVTEIDLNHASTDAFPMHGIVSLTNITDDITVNNPVYLLRAIARVDMNTSAIPENIFKLEGVSVCKTPNMGRWVSDYRTDQNNNPATPIVTDVTMPSSFTPITTVLSEPVVIVDNKIENQLFVYENDAINIPVSRVILAGRFNSKPEIAYYPIDFETQNQEPINILRNHHYTVNITAITGSGYKNIEDAINSETIDIEANITIWNIMGIDGSIDPEIALTMPSKVLLDHTTNNDSYTRIVPYSSNRNVTLYIDGVEVPFPGNNTTVELDIPAAQSNWLTTATWYPINKLEGVFEFTHSTSSYNNPESYIVTLTNGGITRNMEVFVNTIELEQASNCYIIPMSGKTIIIPTTAQINTFWGTTGGGSDPSNVIGNETQWYAEVIWADFDYAGKITINQDGATASDFGIGSEGLSITVADLTKPGNVIVGLKKIGASAGATDYLWSWHLWLTDYDPDTRTDSKAWGVDEFFATTGGQLHTYSDRTGLLWGMGGDYNGALIMDRNLGATVSVTDGVDIPYTTVGFDAFGMHYQWGRKDPFPYAKAVDNVTTQTWGLVTTWPNTVAGTKAKSYSVYNPHQFITAVDYTTGDWQSPQDDESWIDENGTKSLYDPCPYGWKVPKSGTWSAIHRTTFKDTYSGSGVNYGRLYSNGNVKAWYSTPGYRVADTGVLTDIGIRGSTWSSTHYLEYMALHMYLSSGGYSGNSFEYGQRGYGHSVRCLKEP